MSPKSRIGLFTGTFDPIHLGHVALAEAALRSCNLDEVWLMVNPQPSHKAGVVSLPDRMAMVRMALEGHPGLCLYEGDLASKPHTIDVFLTLFLENPDTNFLFVVGADVLGDMRGWRDYERVIELAEFAVARRRDLQIELDPRLRITWFDLGIHREASSRAVREATKDRREPEHLEQVVEAYIRRHGLYRS